MLFAQTKEGPAITGTQPPLLQITVKFLFHSLHRPGHHGTDPLPQRVANHLGLRAAHHQQTRGQQGVEVIYELLHALRVPHHCGKKDRIRPMPAQLQEDLIIRIPDGQLQKLSGEAGTVFFQLVTHMKESQG